MGFWKKISFILLFHSDEEIVGSAPIQIEVHQAFLPILMKEYKIAEAEDGKEMILF